MTERPTLSVIVPVYNMEKYVGDCLASILNLTDESIEVIAVDDGSTDGTKAILHSFVDVRLRVLSVRHGGVSAARNAGFKRSRGKIVLFFDADDIAIADNWHFLLKEIAANPDAVVVYGAKRVFEGNGSDFPRTPSKEVYPPDEAIVPDIFKRNFIHPGAAFIRREPLEAVGLWNESLSHGEDWELWCRLATVGWFIHYPVLVLGYRRHAQSSTGAAVRGDAEDPGLAAIEVIYSHPLVRERTGAQHNKLKNLALAWRSYYWGTTLIRSGAIWPGLRALVSSIRRDPSRFLFLCGLPMRVLQRRSPMVLDRSSNQLSAVVGRYNRTTHAASAMRDEGGD